MEILIIATILGCLPAAIANGKGGSFFLWWLYGALLFIIALPHAILMKPDRQGLEQQAITSGSSKKCPHCAELIKAEAKICRFCTREV